MATLIANNKETPVSRIHLRPGINTLGRGEGNHHVVPHSSVSNRHCEIVVGDESISVRDLGSTNGTFVDDKQVENANVSHGQHLKLGSTEFVVEAPDVVAAPRSGALHVNLPRTANAEDPPLLATGRTASQAIAAVMPVLDDEPSFYRRLPGTFGYPFNKRGILLLGLGALFFLIMELALRFALLFKILIAVFTYGYLFAYMQRIISASAQGEDEVPDFPDVTEFWSDLILPFLLFVGTFVVAFAPPIVIAVLLRGSEWFWLVMVPTIVICALYFPMALLAVAVTDNFLALSPHVVLPSIARVLVPYLVAWAVLAALVGIRYGAEWAMTFVPVPFLPTILMGFISLYLLAVEMRILGLLFRNYRSRLGWL